MKEARLEKKEAIQERYEGIFSCLNERSRRIWAATEAKTYGWGGIMAVCEATGITDKTIRKGLQELGKHRNTERIREKGGGRKSLTEKDPSLKKDLETLIDPATMGDPESPLRWTSKSTYKLAEALQKKGHRGTATTIGKILLKEGYSLQGNRKTLEGSSHPDRNAQFEHINERVKSFLDEYQPAISVDTKKKENIRNFKNQGQEYHRKKQAPQVNVHDFVDKELGKAAPYGVYDLNKNEGWVNVGIDHDTAEFAVESIRHWWKTMGKSIYPNAQKMMITADGGGSNGYRLRLWKVELQKLADELQMEIHVSHFPPGTSKWNKIEHKMFSFISKNLLGKPLVSLETIVNLIGNTTNKKGLKIQVRIDRNQYRKGIKVSDEELHKVRLLKDSFHGEWNYTIKPNPL